VCNPIGGVINISYLSLIVLALAVSLDGFGVGLSYGLRKIQIPLTSILVITGCSSLMILGSMLFGKWIATFTDLNFERKFGACILIGVGCWVIVNFFRNKETSNEPFKSDSNNDDKTPKKFIRINIKPLGFVIDIFKIPSTADLDKSGTIKRWEAVLLGSALSIDAFGAGLGASFMGFSPLITVITVSLFSFSLIILGLRVGLKYSSVRLLNSISVLPGIILITIGVLKLF
jgi:putative sporulation protein YtaF